MQALLFPDKIGSTSSLSLRFSSFSASFGDGYAQTAPNGINPIREAWKIEYPALTKSEFFQLKQQIESVGNWDILTWTPPYSTLKKFRIDGDSVELVMIGLVGKIYLGLIEVF